MLAAAKRNLLEYYTLVGFQDRLAEFFRDLTALYGLTVDPTAVTRLNETGPYQSFVSKEQVEEATRRNTLDMELYEWARERFAAPVDLQPIARPRPGVSHRKLVVGPGRFEVNYVFDGSVANPGLRAA